MSETKSDYKKAEIVTIGGNPSISLKGWHFQGDGEGVGIEYDSALNMTRYCGYTLAELQVIYDSQMISIRHYTIDAGRSAVERDAQALRMSEESIQILRAEIEQLKTENEVLKSGKFNTGIVGLVSRGVVTQLNTKDSERDEQELTRLALKGL